MHTHDSNMARAELMLGQNRYDLAEPHLRLALASDPNDARAHMLLAACLREREQFTEATEEAQAAIGLAPDESDTHWMLSTIYSERHMPKEAMAAINEAIRLWPAAPHYWGQLAALHLEAKGYREAIDAAEHGLRLDPENVSCTNLLAAAQRGIGRKEEAGDSVLAALARNPENPMSHANMGWNLLHQSRPKEALEHFREALRRKPDQEWASQGMVEALRARWLPYRLMLRYFLFMSRLRGRAQWGVIIGGYVAYQIVRGVAKSNPSLAPYLWPLLGAYLAFAVSSWLAVPLFNLVLMTSRFGRLILSTSQRVGAMLLGGTLLVLALAAIAWLGTGDEFAERVMYLGLPIVPAVAIAGLRKGRDHERGWIAMWAWAGCVFAVAAALVIVGGLLPPRSPWFALLLPVVVLNTLAGFGAVWASNIFSTMAAKRRS